MGIRGAAVGTVIARIAELAIVLLYLAGESRLRLFSQKLFVRDPQLEKDYFRVTMPILGAQLLWALTTPIQTAILGHLSADAIAANSFAVTAESICYMPGYGIQSAATTLVGQAVGARRKELAKSFGWLSTLMAMAIMAMTGFAMYFLCPFVFAFLTPVEDVRRLGASVLRIELLAEPWFAASIAASGVMRGAADTLVPGIMNLVSIWGVRIPLAMVLSKQYGLHGVWIGMAVELTFRGLIFLIRLGRGRWLNRAFEG